jgi:hypothetical protein
MGIPFDAYIGLILACEIAFAAVYAAVAALLFWHRPGDGVALFASVALLVFGVATFPTTVHALALFHPAWWLPIAALRFVGMAGFTLFLFAFPDGRLALRWVRPFAFAWIA